MLSHDMYLGFYYAFTHAHIDDIINAGMANKEMYSIVHDPMLWKRKLEVEYRNEYNDLILIPRTTIIDWFSEYKKLLNKTYQLWKVNNSLQELPSLAKILRLLTAAKHGNKGAIINLLPSKSYNVKNYPSNKDQYGKISTDYLNITQVNHNFNLTLIVAKKINELHPIHDEMEIKTYQTILNYFYYLFQSQYGQYLENLPPFHDNALKIAIAHHQSVDTIDKLRNIHKNSHLDDMLYTAALYGHGVLIPHLIKLGANVNNTRVPNLNNLNITRPSPIQITITNGNWNSMKELKKAGAEIPNEIHYLISNANSNFERLLDYFSEHKIDIDTRLENGNTLLHLCIEYRNIKFAKILLSRNAPNCKNKYQLTPLQSAIKNNFTEMQQIIEQFMTSRLVSAIVSGYWDRVNELINDGAKTPFNSKNINNEIHYIICNGEINCEKLIDYLQKKNIDINTRLENGNTLLHLAVAYQNIILVRLLLTLGAKNCENNKGLTPLQVATNQKFTEIKLAIEQEQKHNTFSFTKPSVTLFTPPRTPISTPPQSPSRKRKFN